MSKLSDDAVRLCVCPCCDAAKGNECVSSTGKPTIAHAARLEKLRDQSANTFRAGARELILEFCSGSSFIHA